MRRFNIKMDRLHELEPLEAGRYYPPLRHRNHVPSSCYKTPLKICRLLALLVVVPSAFILIPLYMRYRVFSSQMYPMGMSDMRLIDGKISPTWCQRQVVKSNATFNAFVLPGEPEISKELVPVTMTRAMTLQADMKEYWGFYLLAGSSVTVSACVRRPGASLIMIRGYKHLQDCAYIGDDSSEEMDELIKAEEMGLLSKDDLIQKLALLKKDDGKANQPGTMKRHKSGVSFHDPSQTQNVTSEDPVPHIDVTDHDPQELRKILEHLHAVRQAIKDKEAKEFQLPAHLVAVAKMHRFRDTNVDRDEQKWLTFQDLNNITRSDDIYNIHQFDDSKRTRGQPSSSEYTTKPPKTAIFNHESDNDNNNYHLNQTHIDYNEIISNITKKPIGNNTNQEITVSNHKPDYNKLNKVDETVSVSNDIKSNKTDDSIKSTKTEIVSKIKNINIKNTNHLNSSGTDDVKTRKTLKKIEIEDETQPLPKNTEPDADSKEIFEDVLKRLQSLGVRGKRVLKKLQLSMGIKEDKATNSLEDTIMNKIVGSSEELDRLRRVLVEAIDEERKRTKEQKERSKREVYLGEKTLEQTLNEDDGARDFAAEEDLEPDGYAEHHTKINETSPLDMSNSEFWSSFSSSEEALLECDGLILNLPLTPHVHCEKEFSEEEKVKAAQRNAITYRVPANGYYFFIFNSENEIQENYISARFDLQKTRYDVARATLRECRNFTERCELPLDIFSSQKVVLEVPLHNSSMWSSQYVVVSECEPRASLYLVCVVAAPVLVMLFAFQ